MKIFQEYSARKFTINNYNIKKFSIFYENNNWYICDGSGTKESMNGTWFLADEYIDIYENMIFRAGSTSFSANFYNP